MRKSPKGFSRDNSIITIRGDIRMLERNAKIALTPVAGAVLTALYPAVDAIAQDDGALVLEEIIVTATKRTLSIQDIPATVQECLGYLRYV